MGYLTLQRRAAASPLSIHKMRRAESGHLRLPPIERDTVEFGLNTDLTFQRRLVGKKAILTSDQR